MNQARLNLGGAGTSTNAVAFGGTLDPGNQSSTELWNGSSWTEVSDLNTARSKNVGLGIYTGALSAGGSPALAITEDWSGSAWAEVGDLNTGRDTMAPAGTTTSGLVSSGTTGTRTTAVEEWSGSSNTIKVLTD